MFSEDSQASSVATTRCLTPLGWYAVRLNGPCDNFPPADAPPSSSAELSQDPLDHRSQGPVVTGEAPGPKSRQVLEVVLDEPEQR